MKSDRYARPIIPEAWTRGCYSNPSPIHRATARLIPDVTWYDIIKPLFGEFIARDRWRICGGDAIRNRDWSINVDRERRERERERGTECITLYRRIDMSTKVRSNSWYETISPYLLSRFYFTHLVRAIIRHDWTITHRFILWIVNMKATRGKKEVEFILYFKPLPQITDYLKENIRIVSFIRKYFSLQNYPTNNITW